MSDSNCIFCGGGSSKEHIVPKWLLRDCDLYNVKFKLGFGLQSSTDGFETVMQPQPLSSFYTMSVCAPCNNGWMSQLERQAQKLLTPLIGKEWPSNDKDILQSLFVHSAVLTRWLLKTAATFGAKMTVKVPGFLRTKLLGGQVPEWVYADLAFCEHAADYLSMTNTWNVVKDGEESVRKNDDGFRFTWQIRHLALRVSHFPFTEKHMLKPRYPVRLYPKFMVPPDYDFDGISKRRYAYCDVMQLEHETTYVLRNEPDHLHPLNWGRTRPLP